MQATLKLLGPGMCSSSSCGRTAPLLFLLADTNKVRVTFPEASAIAEEVRYGVHSCRTVSKHVSAQNGLPCGPRAPVAQSLAHFALLHPPPVMR